jgi:hypothetical protein
VTQNKARREARSDNMLGVLHCEYIIYLRARHPVSDLSRDSPGCSCSSKGVSIRESIKSGILANGNALGLVPVNTVKSRPKIQRERRLGLFVEGRKTNHLSETPGPPRITQTSSRDNHSGVANISFKNRSVYDN